MMQIERGAWAVRATVGRWMIGLALAGLMMSVPACTQPAASAGGAFKPSVEGKKLLHYRGPSYEYMKDHTQEMEEVAFDGLIMGGPLAFRDRVKADELNAWADRMAAIPFKRYTDNFYLFYSVPGADASKFDWFDDLDWIVENWRIMATCAKRAGFKGMCFDSEYYEGLPLFGYSKMRHAGTKSLAEYEAQVRLQAARMMKAAVEVFPDMTLLMLFGYSGTYNGVPQHPHSRQENYTLVAAFVDGLLSECKGGATVHDMHEQCFSFRVPGSYARARTMMKDVLAERSHDPAAYAKSHRAGFSFWADCWENASQGRPFDLVDFERNYYTPHEFAYSLHEAMAYSDKYVWMWPGVIDWWKHTARTVEGESTDGKTVVKPLPKEYADTLAWAHAESVPPPPRDRRANTYRNEPASKQQGFSDEATFADLWKTHAPIADLPEQWRFRLDPDEVGAREKWSAPALDEAGWRDIKIREFWELQGPSPYDGQAWYRLTWTPPELPAGKKIALAFGAVADEAEVFVNGKSLYASRYGANIRHERFLVDVTDALQPGKPNTIAVRVWNTGWCGGIWKSVKLVAEK